MGMDVTRKGPKPMKKMFEKLIRLGSGKQKKTHLTIPGFLSWNDFNHRIIQERSRTDRTNAPFTLVSFSLIVPASNEENVHRLLEILASVIRDRTRKSDIKGVHGKENQKLGLILPNTNFEKASIVIQAVEANFREALQALKFNLFQIPELTADVFLYPIDMKKAEAETPAAAPGESQPATTPADTSACASPQEVAKIKEGGHGAD